MLLQHLTDRLGFLDTLDGVGTSSDRLLEEDVGVREHLVELNFDVVLGLQTASELRRGGYKDGPTIWFSHVQRSEEMQPSDSDSLRCLEFSTVDLLLESGEGSEDSSTLV